MCRVLVDGKSSIKFYDWSLLRNVISKCSMDSRSAREIRYSLFGTAPLRMSRADAAKVMAARERCRCVDCQVNVYAIRERYMVHDHVWARAGMTEDGGELCVGCLEQRLGRHLHRRDFLECPLNNSARQSPRLRKRLRRRAVRPSRLET